VISAGTVACSRENFNHRLNRLVLLRLW
jgi:hypothetical protein